MKTIYTYVYPINFTPLGHDALNGVKEWILDSGASFHISYEEPQINFKNIKNEFIQLPDNSLLPVRGKGDVELQVQVDHAVVPFTLTNVRHVPEVNAKLLSEIALAENGFHMTRFGKDFEVRYKGEIVAKGSQKKGPGTMFTLDQPLHKSNTEEKTNYNDDNNQVNNISTFTLQNAHEYFGHISPDRIIQMSESGNYNFKITDKSFKTCDNCSAANLLAPNQDKTSDRIAEFPGQMVNADLIGPIHELNPTAKYVSVLIDRSTNYASVECLGTKDVKMIILHMKRFGQELGHPIKLLRSDNGTEYVNNTMNAFLQQNHITHELTTPHSPAQNGKVERFNRTIIEMAKAMMNATPSRSQELWAYAIDYASWLYNRLPQMTRNNISPYEALTKFTPDYLDANLLDANVGTMINRSHTLN